MREQPFASIERRHAQMQAHDIAGFHLRSDRFGQMFQLRADRIVKRLAILGQLHRLMLAGEQALAHEIFQRAHTARQSGRESPSSLAAALAEPRRTIRTNASRARKGGRRREAGIRQSSSRMVL
jgi:hypothetical protein